MCRWRAWALCALLFTGRAALAGDGVSLELRGGSPTLDYEATLEGDLRQGEVPVHLKARFAASHRALSTEDDGSIPVVLTFGEGGGSYAGAGRTTDLAWSYDGARCLLRYGGDSVVRESVIPLDPPSAPPSMDALAAYFAIAWWIPRPGYPVQEGDSWLRDIAGEPGLTGPALVDRRVLARVDRIGQVAGRQVAFVDAEIETRLRDDHPSLTGRAVIEARVVLDLEAGTLLAARLIETGEVAARDGSDPVRTEGLTVRIALADGPELSLD